VLSNQGGDELELCEYCGLPLSGVVIKHHVKNRSMGGSNDPSNLVKRHKKCEEYCHRHFVHGNPSEGERRTPHVVRKRELKGKNKRKCKRIKMPMLSRAIPRATFREVSPSRPLPERVRTVQDQSVSSIEERMERIERLLFPET